MSSISKFDMDQMQARCDRLRQSGLAAVKNPAVKESLTAETVDFGLEIRVLHGPFHQWCFLHELDPIYSNPSKRSTIGRGVPDFVILYRKLCACVEFKSCAPPEKGLSEFQIEWIVRARKRDVPVLVTNSVKDAIEWTTKILGV